ncbi:MAG: response regulator [Ectothiorhodospira sp.]
MNASVGNPAGRPDGPAVLVVDDSRVMRQALRKILGREYTVHEAVDGEAAWEVLQAEPGIRCVFTDLSMPRLDGYGLLQRIRESGEGHLERLPVVVVTGNEDAAATRVQAESRGADAVVMKPFHAEPVLETAGRLLASVPEAQEGAPVATPPGAAGAPQAPPPTAPSAPSEPEGEALREQLGRAQAQLKAGTEARSRLERELEQLRTELMLRQQTADEAEAKQRITDLERRLEQAEARREGLQAELQEASERLVETDRQMREAARARQEREAEVQRLHRELDSARERTGAAERALAASDGRSPVQPEKALQARAEAAELARLQVEDELVQTLSRLERAQQDQEMARQETREIRARLNRQQRQQQAREEQEAERRQALEEERDRLRAVLARMEGEDRPAEGAEPAGATVAADAPVREATQAGGQGDTGRPTPHAADAAPSWSAGTASPVTRWEVERARKLRLRRGIAWGIAGLVLVAAAFLLGRVL